MPESYFQVLRRISEIIARTPDYQEALRLTVECMAERLNVGACSILVYDETTDKLIMQATYGLEQEAVRHIRLSASEGITGFTFRTGHVVNTADMQRHPEYRAFETLRATEYKSLLVIPLMVGGRLIGVLDLARRRAEEFDASEVDMAQAIASPLAVFIMNAKLAQQVGNVVPTPAIRATSSLIIKGKAVTDGVVRGLAQFLSGVEVLEATSVEYAANLEEEKTLFHEALVIAAEETHKLQEEASAILAEADAAIFYAHLLLLEDPTLIQRIQDAMGRGFTLRFALKVVAEEFEHELQLLDNEFMRERLADMKDVILRIYQAAERVKGQVPQARQGRRPLAKGKPIVVARELLPSQLIRIPLAHLSGIVCEQGGATTHVAILAKALQIPMLVGVTDATKKIFPNDDLILDCSTGSCYVRPTPEVVRRFRPALAHRRNDARQPLVCDATPSVTRVGEPIRVGGNVSLISELPLLERYGAHGVGLYRTEFMFMIRGSYPGEDEQYNVFRRVVEASGDHSVTVRVLDIGGDKPLPYVDFGKEDNPFLGWRGIRFLLSNPQYFEPHLRAILRTTVHGKVNILLPMVADLDELLGAKAMIAQAAAALRAAGIPYAEHVDIGVMIEVPAALWTLPDMLPHLDFVSIGTNDLIQYSFAVDRGNSRVTQWFRQFHPAVLRMIKHVCDVAGRGAGKTVSICGEAAAMPLGVPLLLGTGLRFLSVNPWKIPQVRRVINAVTIAECTELLDTALTCQHDAEVAALMNTFADTHGLREGKPGRGGGNDGERAS